MIKIMLKNLKLKINKIQNHIKQKRINLQL